MPRSQPGPMQTDKPVTMAAEPKSPPRKGMKDYGTNDEMVKWHNMPYAERLKLMRSGQAPSFVAVSSIPARMKYLLLLMNLQQQGLLPGKNAQPGINQKPPEPKMQPSSKPPADRGPANAKARSTTGTDNIQAQMPPWWTRMQGGG